MSESAATVRLGDVAPARSRQQGRRSAVALTDGLAVVGTADGDLLAVPGAQHFRDRDGDSHGLRLFDVESGHIRTVGTEGIVTAAAAAGDTVVAVEEPVVYHDEGRERGAYRLHRLETASLR